MASLKFFLIACMLVACVAADVTQTKAPQQGDEQIAKTSTRSKKDVLLSTITYPYVQPLVQPLVQPFAKTVLANSIHPYYRTVYPYSYYPYSYPYYHSSVYYLRK